MYAMGDQRVEDGQNYDTHTEASDIDEYEFIHTEELNEEGERIVLPNYYYPKTWDNAYNDTVKAVKEVTEASKSYYYAITASGLVQAGKSISGALASSTNRVALEAFDLGMKKSGKRFEDLPPHAKKWFSQKYKMDKAKECAAEGRKSRELKQRHIDRGEILPLRCDQDPSIPEDLLEKGINIPVPSRYSDSSSKLTIQHNLQAQGNNPNYTSVHWTRTSSQANLQLIDSGTNPMERHREPRAYSSVHGFEPIELVDTQYSTAMELPPKRKPHASSLSLRPNRCSNSPTFLIKSSLLPGGGELKPLRGNAEGIPHTPAYTRGIFADLDTPEDVRRQLRWPLIKEMSSLQVPLNTLEDKDGARDDEYQYNFLRDDVDVVDSDNENWIQRSQEWGN